VLRTALLFVRSAVRLVYAGLPVKFDRRIRRALCSPHRRMGQPPDHVTEMIGWLPRGFSVPRLCVEQDADQQCRTVQQDLIFVQDAVDLPGVGMALRRSVVNFHHVTRFPQVAAGRYSRHARLFSLVNGLKLRVRFPAAPQKGPQRCGPFSLASMGGLIVGSARRLGCPGIH